MKDLQLRFGIVLLVIISVVSFMLGRSLRIVMDARNSGEIAAGISGGGSAPALNEENGKSRI